MTPLSFVKMHGLGNDFVILDGRRTAIAPSAARLRAIADRRRGVGCDQVIVMEPGDDEAAVFMRIFNADGTEAGACGNAARCVAQLLMRATGATQLTLRTRRGLLPAQAAPQHEITVDMGAPQLDWRDIPLARPIDTTSLPLAFDGLENPVAVGMGNPHCVFIAPDADAVEMEKLGPRMEHDPLFPERANIGVVSRRRDGALRLRVWERGAGLTPACGSGACAALVAAAQRGLTPRRARLHLDGGALTVEWRGADDHLLMTGPTATVFEGTMTA